VRKNLIKTRNETKEEKINTPAKSMRGIRSSRLSSTAAACAFPPLEGADSELFAAARESFSKRVGAGGVVDST
jgi:hypothetical protein